jgi:hypothetical protein
MPIANVAYANTNASGVSLRNFAPTVVVRLRVDDAGEYVIFGRVVIHNGDFSDQNATAQLTTLDGGTELDRADIRLAATDDFGLSPGAQSVSLQGILTLPSNTADNVIDIRCATFFGLASQASLFAVTVDGFSPLSQIGP